MGNKIETALSIEECRVEGTICDCERVGYTFSKEERGKVMGAIRALALGWGLFRVPSLGVDGSEVGIEGFS